MFHQIEGRDAYSTIRGFVYQVDHTILNWINLQDNEVLELEKGEDVDIVTQALTGDEINRNLGQVKFREDSISLNRTEIFDILLNFFIHIENNPQNELRFSYIANCRTVTERPAIFGNKSAIDVWIELSKFKEEAIDDPRLQTLQSFILTKIQEISPASSVEPLDSIDKTTCQWFRFRNHLSILDNFAVFLLKFEWRLFQGGEETITDAVKTALHELGLIDNPAKIDVCYNRLFIFVFRLLSKPGDKSLTKEALNNLLAADLTINDRDARLLQEIYSATVRLENRMNITEDRLQGYNDKVTELSDLIYKQNKGGIAYTSELLNIDTDPPEKIVNGSLRNDKVLEIVEKLKKYSWVPFVGMNGCGKSQLAALVADEYPTTYWLDLRQFNSEASECLRYLKSFFYWKSNTSIHLSKKAWMKQVLAKFEENSLIVLNDLPQLTENSELESFLIMMFECLIDYRINLISTSNYGLSERLESYVENCRISVFRDFNFTLSEVQEFLGRSGAEDIVVGYSARSILSLSSGNPRIVQTLIRYLKNNNWGDNSENVLLSLLQPESKERLTQDIQRSISKYVTDADTRILLYRLSFIYYTFDIEIVKKIALIDQPIVAPYEKLANVVDLWIQKLSNRAYQVSPLILNIGEENLDEVTVSMIHIAMGDHILSKRKIDFYDAGKAILAYLKGKQPDLAGEVLLNALASCKTVVQRNAAANLGILEYWDDAPIDSDMDIRLRCAIRLEQARIKKSLGHKVSFLIKELENYAAETGISTELRIGIHYNLIVFYDGEEPKKYWAYIDIILAIYESDKNKDKTLSADLLPALVWLPVRYLQNDNDLLRWKQIILRILPFVPSSVWSDVSMEATFLELSIHLRANFNHPDIKSNSESEFNMRLEMVEFFKLHGIEVGAAIFTNEVAATLYMTGGYNEVLAFVNLQLTWIKSLDAKYLIYAYLGKLFYNDGMLPESMIWFRKAIETNKEDQYSFINTLLYAAICSAEKNIALAAQFVQRSAILGARKQGLTKLDVICLQTEEALSYWLLGNHEASFNRFFAIVESLFQLKDTADEIAWMRLFSLCAHTITYAAQVSYDGPEPKALGKGFIRPSIGNYWFNENNFGEFYASKNDSFVYMQLAIWANSLRNYDKVKYCYHRTISLVKERKDGSLELQVRGILSNHLITAYMPALAIENRLITSAAAFMAGDFKDRLQKLDNINLSDFLSDRSGSNWKLAENQTIKFTVIPLFMMIISKELFGASAALVNCNDLKDALLQNIDNENGDSLFSIAHDIIEGVLNGTLNRNKLSIIASKHLTEDNGIHMICVLGILYQEDGLPQIFSLLVNIVPKLMNVFEQFNIGSVNKQILNPFVKFMCYRVLNEYDNNDSIEVMKSRLNILDPDTPNLAQKMLKIIYPIFDIEFPADRLKWLNA